jgi:aldose 1-epimerase
MYTCDIPGGNFLNGAPGKGQTPYIKHSGLCLETQAFPDSVNQSAFPSVILNPEDTYEHEIIYKFS